MRDAEISAEIERLKAQFVGADESKIAALEGMFRQAAYETIFLKDLNEQALLTGLVMVHPDNPAQQWSLPVSNAIAKHSASLTNILDKLCKHCGADVEEDDDELDEYE